MFYVPRFYFEGFVKLGIPFPDFVVAGGAGTSVAPPDRLKSTTTSVFDCSGLLFANPA
jgi:hypothetical protein